MKAISARAVKVGVVAAGVLILAGAIGARFRLGMSGGEGVALAISAEKQAECEKQRNDSNAREISKPAGTKSFPVYWKSWGGGEFARAFRDCSTTGNEVAGSCTGDPRGVNKQLKNDSGWTVESANKGVYYYWTTCNSKIAGLGVKGLDGKPLTALQAMRVKIEAPTPEEECKKTPEKCKPTPPATPLPEPQYRER